MTDVYFFSSRMTLFHQRSLPYIPDPLNNKGDDIYKYYEYSFLFFFSFFLH